MVTEDEGSLIARSRNGDWAAFAVLVRLHQRMVYSLTYCMSGASADADDLAQETFIKAYQSLGTYRGGSRFSSWLYRIALNLCLTWRSRERLRGKADLEWSESAATPAPVDGPSDRVQRALNRLSPKQRAAIVLTVFDGMTHAEAAAALGCAEKTLSWRLFTARRQLAQHLREGEGPA
jgi:RNA polymerase sigma-70 factor (ECF subfamily)